MVAEVEAPGVADSSRSGGGGGGEADSERAKTRCVLCMVSLDGNDGTQCAGVQTPKEGQLFH